MRMNPPTALGLVRRASLSPSQAHAMHLEDLEPRRMLDGGPTIGAVHAPLEPVAPGTRLNITFDDVSAPAGADVTGVSLYRDTNTNGVRDSADELFGTATRDPLDPSRWRYSELVQDNVAVGDVTL